MFRQVVFIAGAALIAVAACGDDDPPAGTGTTTGGASAQCRAATTGDAFCSCEVVATPPADAIDSCEGSTSPNVACCNLPGAGAGGKGACACKTISCIEFSDGSCTCRTGDTSTESERPVEACNKPDEGHCCKAEGSYCTCSASTCFDGDEEVESCDPIAMAETACAAGETKVTDCKAALQ